VKTYSGAKSLDQIVQQCSDQNVPLDDTDHLMGGDTIIVGMPDSGVVVFNTFNGFFTGVTPEGLEFQSDSDEYESQSWFQALLTFFYVEKS
jgi:hypothetical protein